MSSTYFVLLAAESFVVVVVVVVAAASVEEQFAFATVVVLEDVVVVYFVVVLLASRVAFASEVPLVLFGHRFSLFFVHPLKSVFHRDVVVGVAVDVVAVRAFDVCVAPASVAAVLHVFAGGGVFVDLVFVVVVVFVVVYPVVLIVEVVVDFSYLERRSKLRAAISWAERAEQEE